MRPTLDSVLDIELLDTDELLALPPPEWLIKDILPRGDYSVLWGPSGQGKSFVALDWAISIALGRSWQGRHATMQAPVVYIAAEGGRGIQKRVRALMEQYQVHDIPGLYYLIKPLYVREPGAIEAFLDELDARDMWPGLIVIDTLSRSFGGGEENASADMGGFIDSVALLAEGRRTTVLVIHHSNATGLRERGSTALRCGANAMFGCRGAFDNKHGLQGVFLTSDKQKDEAEAEAIYLRTKPMRDSLVLEWAPLPPKTDSPTGPRSPVLMRKVDMLTLLGASEQGYTFTEWRLAAGIPKGSFGKRVRQLMLDGEIYKDENRYYVVPAVTDLAELGREED